MLAARFGQIAGGSPHLGDRLGRRPDGGDQPRGDRPGRPPAAVEADRPLRRQPISIDGETALACSDDELRRFAAHGWAVKRVDGHDAAQVTRPSPSPCGPRSRRLSHAGPSSAWAPRPRPARPRRMALRSVSGRRRGLGSRSAGTTRPSPSPMAWPNAGERRARAARRRGEPGLSGSPGTRCARNSSGSWRAGCRRPGTRRWPC